jgi:hypothetical protein
LALPTPKSHRFNYFDHIGPQSTISWHQTTEQLNAAPLPISTLRACWHSAPLFLLSDSWPFPPLLVPPNVKKRLSRLSIRHHPPALGSIATRQETRRKHRPKWPSFTCAISCLVLIPTVLDPLTHSVGSSVNRVPICKDRATQASGHNPHQLP